jgi:shikimate kinase
MKNNIALIGFMGTGKSTIGRILADSLGKNFVELDALIEKSASKTIPEIFTADGEEGFRRLETAALKEVLKGGNMVISCGGGVVLKDTNTSLLKQRAVVALLTASPNALLKRTFNANTSRPLLNVKDKPEKIRELLDLRRPLYIKTANITLDNTNLNPQASTEALMDLLKQYERDNK